MQKGIFKSEKQSILKTRHEEGIWNCQTFTLSCTTKKLYQDLFQFSFLIIYECKLSKRNLPLIFWTLKLFVNEILLIVTHRFTYLGLDLLLAQERKSSNQQIFQSTTRNKRTKKWRKEFCSGIWKVARHKSLIKLKIVDF